MMAFSAAAHNELLCTIRQGRFAFVTIEQCGA
jgi:hypothetical protein